MIAVIGTLNFALNLHSLPEDAASTDTPLSHQSPSYATDPLPPACYNSLTPRAVKPLPRTIALVVVIASAPGTSQLPTFPGLSRAHPGRGSLCPAPVPLRFSHYPGGRWDRAGCLEDQSPASAGLSFPTFPGTAAYTVPPFEAARAFRVPRFENLCLPTWGTGRGGPEGRNPETGGATSYPMP